MYLYCVLDVDAHRSGDPFLAVNETVMKRTVYLKFKDYPFVSSLKITCLGYWDDDMLYDPIISRQQLKADNEHGVENGLMLDIVDRDYKVVEIMAEVSKAIKAGQLEPESSEVVSNA